MLHLVGILFPHINDDARSKSHQTRYECVKPDVHIRFPDWNLGSSPNPAVRCNRFRNKKQPNLPILQDTSLNMLTYLYIKQQKDSNTTQTQTLSSLHIPAPQPAQSQSRLHDQHATHLLPLLLMAGWWLSYSCSLPPWESQSIRTSCQKRIFMTWNPGHLGDCPEKTGTNGISVPAEWLQHHPFHMTSGVPRGGGLGCSTPPPPKFRRYRWSPRSHKQVEPASRFPFAVHCVLIRL